MIKLSSFKNSFSRYGIIHDDGSFEIIEKELLMEDLSDMNGFFDLLNNDFFGFFKKGKNDFLFYNKKTIGLPIGYEIKYSRLNSENCIIKFTYHDNEILNINYHQPDYGLIERIGYTESEDDYNFGLWLYNKYLRDRSEAT